MARPQKQGMDYFPHDTDASSDEKVDVLRMIHGNDGYAFYFILLERIYRTSNFELDVSDEETRQILARKVDVSLQKFNDMISTALKRRCFDPDAYEKRGVLTSPGIKKRSGSVVSKRQNMANKYQERVSSSETKQKPHKVKESKVKESKEYKEGDISIDVDKGEDKSQSVTPDTKVKLTGNGQMVKPDLHTLSTFVLAQGGTQSIAQEIFDFYASKGWIVGKSPMKDWNAAARKWVRHVKDERSGRLPINGHTVAPTPKPVFTDR